MQLSRRLAAVQAMVTPGGTVADVGTDHAYIPIYLILDGRIARAIAMDVNRGPLARAQEHISRYGLEGAVTTRLSDGLEALHPGEADSVVIAGMGGALTVRILEDGQGKLAGCRELILQPQSEIRLVRAWLWEHGWRIDREDMVFEDGKYYPMMRAKPEDDPGVRGYEAMEEAALRYGPLLLRERHPVLREYLLREYRKNRGILETLLERPGEAPARRVQELREELAVIGEALAGYGSGFLHISDTEDTGG